jgi:hypothetical protein
VAEVVSSKNHEKRCARLVQEAESVTYGTALRWVREDEVSHPETMPAETRALRIIDERARRLAELGMACARAT